MRDRKLSVVPVWFRFVIRTRESSPRNDPAARPQTGAATIKFSFPRIFIFVSVRDWPAPDLRCLIRVCLNPRCGAGGVNPATTPSQAFLVAFLLPLERAQEPLV